MIDKIKNLLGPQAATRLKNKKTGGSNNEKGSAYEECYLTYVVVLAAANHDFKSPFPYFEKQPYAFVDDLLIKEKTQDNYFQLKNVESDLTWSGGLLQDFSYQEDLLNSDPTTTKLTLICSNQRNVETLTSTRPPHLVSTQIIYFPYYASLTRYLHESTSLQAALKAIQKENSDNLADQQAALAALHYATKQHPKGAALKDIYQTAAAISPQVLKLPYYESKLKEELRTLLTSLHIKVTEINGFLSLSAYGTELKLPFHTSTHDFELYQSRILQFQPSSFFELEQIPYYE